MKQWNKETIEEQLKLHKKQNKDDRYNYMCREFNSLWYCWELEKYSINQQKEIEQLNNIINAILEFPFLEEECPLNFGFNEKELEEKAQDIFYQDEWCEKNCDGNYKKCWLKYFDKLKELKESGNNE